MTIRLRINKIQTLQPLHHGFVGYQPSDGLIDLAKKAFPADESRTQARKYKRNLKLQICIEANQIGVQALESKGLINTVEEMQEQGPWITVKGLVATVTMIDLSFMRKTRC